MPDAPASMVRLFEEFEQDPVWLDLAEAERGARAFRRFGPSGFSFAGVETLLAYTENSVVQPLLLTGEYAGNTALKRFMETARFWIDVSEPGGLASGSPGRATAMRVRVMHVFVRRHLSEHEDWDADAWGVPISQSDALTTLLAGCFTPGLAMHLLGYRSTGDDMRAMMHFWRYVGHLMGVQPRWYPQTLREATQVMAYDAALRGYEQAAVKSESTLSMLNIGQGYDHRRRPRRSHGPRRAGRGREGDDGRRFRLG